MKILFLCLSGLKFDVTTPETEPLGGSESAICYLSQELAKLGHDITMASRESKDFTLRGVKHKNANIFNPRSSHFDFIVVINSLAPFEGLKRFSKSINILWCHMMPDQPAMHGINNHNTQASIDRIVYVSSRQAEKYKTNIPSVIIGNAPAPCFHNLFRTAKELLDAKECRGVYTSTPFRGLEHLAKIREIPLHVYSSMAVYQQPENQYIKLYESLTHNPTIKMHGSLCQPELADELKKSAFLIYPCTFPECHSITLLEAKAAGCKIITTKAAADEDSFAAISEDTDDFKDLLQKNVAYYHASPHTWAQEMFQQMKLINENYTWAKQAKEWEQMFETLKSKQAA